MSPKRLAFTLKAVVQDLRASVRLGADPRSRWRLSADFVLSRFAGLLPRKWRNRVREVGLRDDVRIRYRLNKGDLHSIREIWFQHDYWLPFDVQRGVLLDLGANIGMAGVWLAKRFGFTRVIAVEPDPDNAALVEWNLQLNGITHQVLQAAIGPKDGTARFESSERSNLGRLSEHGSVVRVVSVDTIMTMFEVKEFSLIKIDIEGSENQLFNSATGWLARTQAVVIEFHPNTDCPGIQALMGSEGFQYIPAHSLLPDNMPCFTRERSRSRSEQMLAELEPPLNSES